MIAQAVRLRQSAMEERERLLEENMRLQEELKDRFRPANIIGNSKAMQAVYDLIAQVSKSDATVLIRGESGTGKELVAHAIHYNSPRAGKPFIKVNCAALPETLIESELFGHEKGAFTGARRPAQGPLRAGRRRHASSSTRSATSRPATQIKLLRVLQEREFERVGGTETIKVDVRVIAATNRDLEELIARGQVPRRTSTTGSTSSRSTSRRCASARRDILLLADHFVEKYSQAEPQERSGASPRRPSTC